MSLPPSADPLLGRLYDFLAAPPMDELRAETARLFAESVQPPELASARLEEAYLLHNARDGSGRSAIDIFLEANKESISTEEQDAYLAMKNGFFGFFAVEEVHSPDTAALRRVGSDETFEVQGEGAFDFKVQHCAVFVCLVPYQDSFGIASFPIFFLGDFVDFLEELKEQNSGVVVPGLEDPLFLGELLDTVADRGDDDDDDDDDDDEEEEEEEDGDEEDPEDGDLEGKGTGADALGLSPLAVEALGVQDLPDPDRLVWPSGKLRSRIAELLEERKMTGLALALQELARRGEPLPEDALAAALKAPHSPLATGFLIEKEDNCYPHDLLPSPVGKQLADAIAARRDAVRGTPDYEYLLLRLIACDPASHADVFAQALSEHDPDVQCSALAGLVAAGRPEAAPALLKFVLTHDSPAFINLCVIALAGLLRFGDAPSVHEAAQRILERLPDLPEVEFPPLESLPDYLDPTGLDANAFYEARETFVPEMLLSTWEALSSEDRIPILEPEVDPAAARRSGKVVTHERKCRIAEAVMQDDREELHQLLAEMALEAMDMASSDNPGFAPLGKRLGAFVKVAASAEVFDRLETENQDSILALLGMFLTKAIRGRDTLADIDAARADRTRLHDLLRVDEFWLPRDLLSAASKELSEENLLALAGSNDTYVSLQGALALAVRDPRKYDELLLESWLPEYPRHMSLLREAMRLRRDALADPVADLFEQTPQGCPPEQFAFLMAAAGTQRALYHLQSQLEFQTAEISAFDILEDLVPLAEQHILEEVCLLLREGAFMPPLFNDPEDYAFHRKQLEEQVRALAELCGAEDDAAAVADECFQAWEDSGAIELDSTDTDLEEEELEQELEHELEQEEGDDEP